MCRERGSQFEIAGDCMYMCLADLMAEQRKDLDYKIKASLDSIAGAFRACNRRAAIAFSGGKDSTVLWHLIRTYFPQELHRVVIIFGNTGVEYPESLAFARSLGNEWGKDQFHEAAPGKTECEGYKYAAQREILAWLISCDRIGEVLTHEGKLKTTAALESVCPGHLREKFEQENLIWREGTRQNYWWCIDQYGWPLLGKAFSKLKAHRINIDCFLQFSESKSEKPELLAYYDILREVKISQACCDILKKEPSERLQAELDVDVIFKGLMAAESRTRQTNFVTRGYLFESHRDYLGSDSFFHCNPISIWTDDDIWAYIRRYNVPYSPLYDMGWTDDSGDYHKIKRNGCMGCGTDLLYKNNHMAMLRRTHPGHWKTFMRKGMAAEMQKLMLTDKGRGPQMSLLDYLPAEWLIDNKPCAFDRIDRLVLSDSSGAREEPDFDPEGDVA